MPPAEYLEKKTNWTAMIISGKRILRFAERYAELARRLAAEEADEARRQELEEIAATLDQVPARPARTFREAVQFDWMIEVAARFVAVYGHGRGFRFDQIFWPDYEADLRGRPHHPRRGAGADRVPVPQNPGTGHRGGVAGHVYRPGGGESSTP